MPMTVGIATICENGDAIIMAADRLTTLVEANQITEMDAKKLVPLTPQIAITSAGTMQDSEYVSERLRHASNLLTHQSVYQVANRLRRSCARIRERQIEERIIRPSLAISFSEFSAACLTNQLTTIAANVMDKVTGFKLNLELLVAGIDDSGAHLYWVNNQQVNSYSGLGYMAIGVGSTLAAVSLARYGGSSSHWTTAEATYRVYEAKRLSQETNLVGGKTDMMLLSKGKEPEYLSDELIQLLEAVYVKQKPPALSSEELADINRMLTGRASPPES
jgi:20S proteasome alpha/beta subunit